MKFIIVTFIGYLFLTVKLLDAFCIYNNLNPEEATFWIRQEPDNAGWNYFSRFKRTDLAPGESACCPYNNSDCVRPQTKDAILHLVIRRKRWGEVETEKGIVISFPGGGSVTFSSGTDSPFKFLINVYNADGSPFDYDYRFDEQAGSY
ncbi:hypothetical protein BD770DRAFT_413638 [Pilaira anomala]|nr:hypothetical protein BD770DRAFT_413638 [Pilaira anomala]